MKPLGLRIDGQTSMQISNFIKLFSLNAIMWGASGCLLTGSKHVTAEYSRQIAVASARSAQVETSLGRLESRLKNLESAIRKRGQEEAQRLENLDQVNSEISRLRGQIEEMNFVIQDLRLLYEKGVMDQERRQLHDEARLKQIEGYLGISAPPPPAMSIG